MSLVVLNLAQATFDCTFGRGCDGICCRNGRPPVYPEEAEIIQANLPRILPLMRPEARDLAQSSGFLSRRRKAGQPSLRVIQGWCIFFNQGCTLHQFGAAEGDPFRFKPVVCAFFPLAKDESGDWYVRQKGFRGEIWDLACLDPAASPLPAAESLRAELAIVERLNSESAATEVYSKE